MTRQMTLVGLMLVCCSASRSHADLSDLAWPVATGTRLSGTFAEPRREGTVPWYQKTGQVLRFGSPMRDSWLERVHDGV